MKHSKAMIIAMIPACVCLLGAGQAAGQSNITVIIDRDGDGAGNRFGAAKGIAVDAAGNVYVAGASSDNAFKITPATVGAPLFLGRKQAVALPKPTSSGSALTGQEVSI